MRFWRFWFAVTFGLITVASVGVFSGCGSSPTIPAGALVGRAHHYDYSPSVIETGDQLQVWWCGDGLNPQDSSQYSDTILYSAVDMKTGRSTKPVIVLAETRQAWDSVFTCNPRVIRGSFVNPLGDGAAYTYAMYYVATSDPHGTDNSIGVAFSNDGVQWNKYRDPVIDSNTIATYGYGQPVAYNVDGKSQLRLFYEDSRAATEHVVSTTTDGIHFTEPQKLTRNGLDPDNPNPPWGDMGFDPATGYWYAAFNLTSRNAATLGDVTEIASYGIQLYRIQDSSLLNGATPWELVKTFDTNSTGYEDVFVAGFRKDQYGNLSRSTYPAIQMFPTITNPQTRWDEEPKELGLAGDVLRWDIGLAVSWTPGDQSLALIRYKNSDSYNTTSGYRDPSGHFAQDAAIGHLTRGLANGTTVPFYACKQDAKDFFVSRDSLCEGHYILGLEGYGFAEPVPGQSNVAIYSCISARRGHFVSRDAQCEGASAGTLLGYALP